MDRDFNQDINAAIAKARAKQPLTPYEYSLVQSVIAATKRVKKHMQQTPEQRAEALNAAELKREMRAMKRATRGGAL